VFVYKQINFTVMKKILHSTVLTTSTIGFIIAAASFFGMWLTLERVPYTIAEAFQSSGFTPFFTMILITLFLLLLGCFMDATAALIITTPILFPIAVDMGFDPVHFGIIMIVNLSIGYLTPPLGVGLFVAAKVGGTRFESLIKPVLPFVFILIIDVILIILLPQISSGIAEMMAS